MKYLNKSLKALLCAALLGFSSCSDDDGKLDSWMSLSNELGNVFPSVIETDFIGGEYIMNIYTNTEWTFTSDVDWVKAEPAGRIGCVTGKLIVETSDVTTEREATITLRSADPSLRTYNILVKQGATPSYVLIDEFHVLPTATGDATGSDWDNAMGPLEMKDLLSNGFDTNGRSMILGEGTFELPTNIKIAKTIAIKGQGKDKTILKPQSMPTSTTTFFKFNSGANVSFEDLSFDAGYATDDKGYLRAFEASGTNDDTFTLTDCGIYNFNLAGPGGDWDGRGAMLYFNRGKVYWRNVDVCNCVSTSRGNIALAGQAEDGFIFLDGCSFTGNRILTDWGIVLHGNSPVLANNCTFVDNKSNKGGGYVINYMSDGLLANTTIYEPAGSTVYGLVRVANLGNVGVSEFTNCLMVSDDSRTSVKLDEESPAESKGYNLMNNYDGGALLTLSGTETIITGAAGANVDASSGLVNWSMPTGITKLATTGEITAAIKGYRSNKAGALGSQFSEWLNGNETKDATGKARNENGTAPGAVEL